MEKTLEQKVEMEKTRSYSVDVNRWNNILKSLETIQITKSTIEDMRQNTFFKEDLITDGNQPSCGTIMADYRLLIKFPSSILIEVTDIAIKKEENLKRSLLPAVYLTLSLDLEEGVYKFHNRISNEHIITKILGVKNENNK